MENKIILWLLGNDTGTSSKALCAYLCGIQPTENHNYPHDPSDFGRCKRFLDILTPEEKERALQKAAKASPQWKALVEKWGLLEKMYNEHDRNMYKQMRKIINGGTK